MRLMLKFEKILQNRIGFIPAETDDTFSEGLRDVESFPSRRGIRSNDWMFGCECYFHEQREHIKLNPTRKDGRRGRGGDERKGGD